eukprot:gene5030-5272_t
MRAGVDVLWISSFTLGMSLFTPVYSFSLSIDYYEATFPGEQVAVKADLCYLVSFVVLQLVCHLADAKLPVSRPARIKLRHTAVLLFMALVIVWVQVINGAYHRPPRHMYVILLAIVALTGMFDGSCMGALFGECAMLGPNAVHGVLAGSSGVAPLLAVMRIVVKATLPATMDGLRLSIVLYFAVPILVASCALALYCLVVLPAISQAIKGDAQQPAKTLTVLPLVPTIISTAGSDAPKGSSRRPLSLSYTLSVPSSMRGSCLIVRRSSSNLPAQLLSVGSSLAAADVRRRGMHAAAFSTSATSTGKQGQLSLGVSSPLPSPKASGWMDMGAEHPQEWSDPESGHLAGEPPPKGALHLKLSGRPGQSPAGLCGEDTDHLAFIPSAYD